MITDPGEAVETVASMLLNSPGGSTVKVNGTTYRAQQVQATMFHETASWTNSQGDRIPSGPYGPEGYYTYQPHVVLSANGKMLNEIPVGEVLKLNWRSRRRYLRGTPEDRKSVVADLPQIAAVLAERCFSTSSHRLACRDGALAQIERSALGGLAE